LHSRFDGASIQQQSNGGVVHTDPGEVTRLLSSARAGDDAALDKLVPLVYDDLRALARRQLGREHGPRTLQPTALVHEAYMKLSGGAALAASDRSHFMAIAGRAMRQILVERARHHLASRRGGGWEQTTLTDGSWTGALDADQLIALSDALDTLEPRQRQVVECRFFAGLEEKEIADALGVTERTVRRDWTKARAWLYRELYGSAEGSTPTDVIARETR
jgi:RNA polymerase sigma factor (TIGR02999 family)